MSKYVIWWTSEADCEMAMALGAESSDWPKYISLEFLSRFGRAARGRLWIPNGIKFPDIDWYPGDKAFDEVGKDYGGIVIRSEDAHHIAPWPGFVTDRNLKPVKLA